MMRLLYWLYGRLLGHQVRRHPAPHHVGIILDGNRRFARERGYSDPRVAYELGAEKLDDVLAWCIDLEIRAVMLWVFSIDNMRRPPAEVSAIMAAVERKIAALAEDPSILSRGVRLRAAGRLDLLPVSTADVIREATERTTGNEPLTVTIAIAYGGREEIVDAVRKVVRQKRQQGVDLDTILDELSPAAIDEYLFYRRRARSRSHYSHKRRGPPFRLSPLAKRQQRALFFRRELAGVPQAQFSPRRSRLSAPPPSLRKVGFRAFSGPGMNASARLPSLVMGFAFEQPNRKRPAAASSRSDTLG
ncbi:polyprenyl diphosphate synthase [Mesorhizobium sp. 14Argb]